MLDPDVMQIIRLVAGLLPYVAIIVALGVGGSVLSTWLKIKNGYPLSNSWGMPLHPKVDREERQFWQGVRASPTRAARDIRSRFKDIDRRLADIESYVTTENRSLAREIEQLR